MKDSQKWAIVFSVINIILIVVCCVLLLGKDKKAPGITFGENNVIYYSGIETDKLLDGVIATDNQDGDISDQVVVEKIVQNKEEGRVVVYYAVMDQAGNVAKASRVFDAVNESTGNVRKDIGMAGIDGELDTALTEEAQQEDTADVTETADAEADNSNTEDADAAEAAEEEASRKQQEQLEEEQRKQEEEQKKQEEEERKAREEREKEEEARQRAAEEEQRRAAEEAAKAGNPKIVLKSTTVNTTAGKLPAWVDVIGSFQDDVDGYETLFKNLKASKYDVNAKGDHSVSLTTTDSDGNVSDPVTVTVHVK